MHDELERWTADWRALEVAPVAMLAESESLRRQEARSWIATATLAGVAATGIAATLGSLAWTWARGGFISGGLLAGEIITSVGLVVVAGAVSIWRRQVARERGLTHTPTDLVEDLISTRERQLFWTAAKPVWITTALFVTVLAATSLLAGYEHVQAGRSAIVFWVTTGAYLACTIVGGVVAVFRARFLKRELSALDAIHQELVDASRE